MHGSTKKIPYLRGEIRQDGLQELRDRALKQVRSSVKWVWNWLIGGLGFVFRFVVGAIWMIYNLTIWTAVVLVPLVSVLFSLLLAVLTVVTVAFVVEAARILLAGIGLV